MFREVKSINLEITNKCMLRCSKCARTNNPEIHKNLTDLKLEQISSIFTDDVIATLSDDFVINLCGVYGDSIYHQNFHEVIKFLKLKGLKLNIETNGSYKDEKWWGDLLSYLSPEDIITFSIDGLKDTNHLYRVNSRWEDIMMGMRLAVQSPVKVYWKYIVFSHNEHQLGEAKKLAKNLGVNRFIIRKSGRYNQGDDLMPDKKWVGLEYLTKVTIDELRKESENIDDEVVIVPRCINSQKNLGVTFDGHVFPCVTSSSEKNGWFAQKKSNFDLTKYSLDEILKSDAQQELEFKLEKASTAPKVCLEYCGVKKSQFKSLSKEEKRNPVKSLDREIFILNE